MKNEQNTSLHELSQNPKKKSSVAAQLFLFLFLALLAGAGYWTYQQYLADPENFKWDKQTLSRLLEKTGLVETSTPTAPPPSETNQPAQTVSTTEPDPLPEPEVAPEPAPAELTQKYHLNGIASGINGYRAIINNTLVEIGQPLNSELTIATINEQTVEVIYKDKHYLLYPTSTQKNQAEKLTEKLTKKLTETKNK
jgi:hypothetical protein